MPKGVYLHSLLSLETKEKIRKNSAKYWLGKHLSEETKKKISATLKKNPVRYWLGKKRLDMVGHKWNNGRKPSDECRRKISEANKGKNSYFWKDGRSKIYKRERELACASVEYRIWRSKIFERDNYQCVKCGDKNHKNRGKSIKLYVDHIKPWKLFPKLRYDLKNGQTLCFKCHLLKTKEDKTKYDWE